MLTAEELRAAPYTYYCYSRGSGELARDPSFPPTAYNL